MNDQRSALPEAITLAMRVAGISQKQLADQMGVSPAAINAWVSGARYPRPELLQRLADALGVPTAQLVGGSPSSQEITQEEEQLLAAYRQAVPILRDAAMAVLTVRK